jgi:P-type E1-E2 ATPase
LDPILNEYIATHWSRLNIGDIIKVKEGEYMPADVILLRSSLTTGECFVTTATLDGERALKAKLAMMPIIDYI